jgi:hypothetical protein
MRLWRALETAQFWRIFPVRGWKCGPEKFTIPQMASSIVIPETILPSPIPKPKSRIKTTLS